MACPVEVFNILRRIAIKPSPAALHSSRAGQLTGDRQVQKEKFLELEYPTLRAMELALMTAQRWQIWALYLSLVTALGIAAVSIQNDLALYLPALLPPLIALLARYARHGEDVLRQIRKYLYKSEKECGCQAYEHFCREVARPTHGGHIDAMRDAFLITEVSATVLVVIHLILDHLIGVTIPSAGAELLSMYMTYHWLQK